MILEVSDSWRSGECGEIAANKSCERVEEIKFLQLTAESFSVLKNSEINSSFLSHLLLKEGKI